MKPSRSSVASEPAIFTDRPEEAIRVSPEASSSQAIIAESTAEKSAPLRPAGSTPFFGDQPKAPQDAAVTQSRIASDEAASQPAEEILELLSFQLAAEEYAIDLLSIREIIRWMEATRVPRTVPFIKGIISLRGTIVPIFDLRTRLGLSESPPAQRTRILVVTSEKGLMGLIADHVTEVVKIPTSKVEPPPSTGGQTSGYLKGVAHVNGRLLILLNLENAVAMD